MRVKPVRTVELRHPLLAMMTVAFVWAALAYGHVAGSLAVALLIGSTVAVVFAAVDVARRERIAATALLAMFLPWFVLRSSAWLLWVDGLAIAVGCLYLLVARPSDSLPLEWRTLWNRTCDVVEGAVSSPLVLARWLTTDRHAERAGRVAAGVRVAIAPVAVLVVVLALLISGDALFSSYLAFETGGFNPARFWLAVAGVVLFVVLVGVASRLPDAAAQTSRLAIPSGHLVGARSVLIGLGGLAVLLTAFGAVQLSGAILGSAYVTERTGLTFAEWARSGFFELVLVAAISAVSVGAAAAVAARPDAPRRLLAVLSAIVTVGVVALVVASVVKLGLYVDAFGLTMLRIYTTTFAIWIGVVAIVMLGAVFGFGVRWVLTVVVATALLGALVMNFVNPERLVAEHNLERYVSGEIAPTDGAAVRPSDRFDVDYVETLSTDAVPTLLEGATEFSDADGVRLLDWLCQRPLPKSDGFDWNMSASAALAAREEFCS